MTPACGAALCGGGAAVRVDGLAGVRPALAKAGGAARPWAAKEEVQAAQQTRLLVVLLHQRHRLGRQLGLGVHVRAARTRLERRQPRGRRHAPCARECSPHAGAHQRRHVAVKVLRAVDRHAVRLVKPEQPRQLLVVQPTPHQLPVHQQRGVRWVRVETPEVGAKRSVRVEGAGGRGHAVPFPSCRAQASAVIGVHHVRMPRLKHLGAMARAQRRDLPAQMALQHARALQRALDHLASGSAWQRRPCPAQLDGLVDFGKICHPAERGGVTALQGLLHLALPAEYSLVLLAVHVRKVRQQAIHRVAQQRRQARLPRRRQLAQPQRRIRHCHVLRRHVHGQLPALRARRVELAPVGRDVLRACAPVRPGVEPGVELLSPGQAHHPRLCFPKRLQKGVQ
mmetsp:Transcript_31265/g.80208  ORF Transcript_31265/g.80208 Transcript_31265/m.80208 type:complete len:396 (-) Transcript_31265:99-1286(-)